MSWLLQSVRASLGKFRGRGDHPGARRRRLAPAAESLEGRRLLSTTRPAPSSVATFEGIRVEVRQTNGVFGDSEITVDVSRPGLPRRSFTHFSPQANESLPAVAVNRVNREILIALAYQSRAIRSRRGPVRIESAFYDLSGRRQGFAIPVKENTGIDSTSSGSDSRFSTRPAISLGDRGRWVVAYVTSAVVGGRDTTDIEAVRFEPRFPFNSPFFSPKRAAPLRVTTTPDRDSAPIVRIHTGGDFGVAYEYFVENATTIDTGTVAFLGARRVRKPVSGTAGVDDRLVSMDNFDGSTTTITVDVNQQMSNVPINYRD